MVVCSTAAFSQHAEIKNDTAYYGKAMFYEGKEVTLGYGSGDNKKFAFVAYGSKLQTWNAGSDYAKRDFVVTEIYKQKNKVFLKMQQKEKGFNPQKVFVDLEGAIDNKEIIVE